MRFFNTTGPVVPPDHYSIPPLGRLDLDEVRGLIRDKRYFVLHAPRQTGKTSVLLAYKEAGSQLLLPAFLQRIVNGGGRIEREYGLGRRRTDLLVFWPRGDRVRKFVVECKVVRNGRERTIREGLAQTADYADRCGAEAGHLVVFDRGAGAWSDRIFHRRTAAGGVEIQVWGT